MALPVPTPIPEVHVVVDHIAGHPPTHPVLPVVHVVVDHAVRILPPAAGPDILAWVGAAATIALTFGTFFLGIAALATIIANDIGNQEQLLPLVDLANVTVTVPPDINAPIEVEISFDLVNDGGGPAKEVRLRLAHYGDEDDLGVSYLGAISPGQRRHDTQTFKLRTRVHGQEIKPLVLVVSYEWMRPGFGESYIHMYFPGTSAVVVIVISLPPSHGLRIGIPTPTPGVIRRRATRKR